MERKVRPEKENSERWVLTYADLITLLTVFFIVLYSMANVDSKKFEKMSGSLASAFDGIGIFSGQSPVKGETGGEGIVARFVTEVQNLVTKRSGVGFRQGTSQIESTIEQDFTYISNRIDELVISNGLADKVSVERSSEGIVLNLAGDLLFLNARADLRSESYFVLDRIAELIRPLPNRIRVEGHTDNIPPLNEAFPSNWHLSGARALAVLQFLEQFGKIPRDRMHYSAWADLRPVAGNEDLEGRLKNRRASIVIVYPELTQAPTQDELNKKASSALPIPAGGAVMVPASSLPQLPSEAAPSVEVSFR